MTGGHDRPLVTIGIPLYRARPFVDRILSNIESIDDPDVEFVVADQHGLDDAIAILETRLGADPRVRFFATRDELDWIGNYNFVLDQAIGKYFRLLAQDDVIPPESLRPAIECLQSDPTVVVVDGPVDIIDGAARLVRKDSRGADRARRLARWPLLDSLALFTGWRHEGANLGLVRRSVVVDHQLWIPRTRGMTGLSVRAWLFALSLRGCVRTVPEYVNLRCVHGKSFTSRHRGRTARQEAERLTSYLRVSLRLWREARRGVVESVLAVPLLVLGALVLLPMRRALQRLAAATARRASP